ncbi:unnamed protein product [Prorocentrum cordatum]|uniref:Uncharacterized protein n=1 Tax=Prorocentrum cordatum TaxID=2364126 RepID=A0ABN9SX89_9DINO|nr:unnamed protein product [Polarella glacialis]
MPSTCSSVWAPIAPTARALNGACAAPLGASSQPSTPRWLSSPSPARPPTQAWLSCISVDAVLGVPRGEARAARPRPDGPKRSPSLRARASPGFTSTASRKPFLTTSWKAAAPRRVAAGAPAAPGVSRAAPRSIPGAALAISATPGCERLFGQKASSPKA